MDKLLPYWKFFCDNSFAESDKLFFFNDGCFVITTADKVVSLYSAQAEFVKSYNNAFALSNGCICEHYGENLIVHHKDTQYPIPCPSGTKILQYENAAELTTINRDEPERRLYFITPQRNNLRYIALKEDLCVQGTSTDGKAALYDKKSNLAILFDNTGQVLDLKASFFSVDFLPSGGYIVHFIDGTVTARLYNKDNESVLSSKKDFGISPCGDVVNYEGALIADFDGHFIDEYRCEHTIYGDLHIFPYTICSKGGQKRFWPGGKMMHFSIRNIGRVLCYWYDGHFYFAPQNTSNYWDFLGIFNDASKSLQRYITRVNELRSC